MNRKFSYFFSPVPDNNITNNYVSNFYYALLKKRKIVTDRSKSISNSVDILRASIGSDVMILNWPEDILYLRFGLFQMFISLIGIILFKAFKNRRLVWICHNLKSHKKSSFTIIQRLIQQFYLKKSDLIIVHSKDALKHLRGNSSKVFFIPHPAYPRVSTRATDHTNSCDVDVLIWGNILPYKGIKQFIDYYKKVNASFNVLIIGRGEKNYINDLLVAVEGLNIEVKNVFLNDYELQGYFHNSKIILLPYLKDATTSGALIHSLHSGKIIIGPAIGNFLDLYQLNSCLIYHSSKELFLLLQQLINDAAFYDEKLLEVQKGMDEYVLRNTWNNFIDKLLLAIE